MHASPALRCTPLTGLERRLLDHFYRQHGSRMRTPADGQLWVARSVSIVAGLSLTPVEGGHWLTGLLVAPQWRQRGVASSLMTAAMAGLEGTVWLFCHPDLLPFYRRLCFEPAVALPEALAGRLHRYQRHKPLIALQSTPCLPPAGVGIDT
ncbi:GNAT family N-acetyltransferase [Pseudomonas alabamensis]|uniref:GNAT family N-acetyltransferase n=1 Tax=Pseudomonas alabamensis TaxID=3064349 RepID=UPI003F64C125